MARTWTHRKACRLCNSRHVVPSLKFAFTPPEAYEQVEKDTLVPVEEVKVPLILSLCEKCHLVQSLDIVKPNLLFDQYPCHASSGAVLKEYEALAVDIINRGKLHKGDLVVDVGCGNGALLNIFRGMGMKVVGVDPSGHSASIAKELGIPHYREYFSPATANQIIKEHGPVSVVTATFSLGSIDNLHAVCSGIRHMLKPDGQFHFVEPYLADLFEHVSLDLIHHERISLFSLSPLEVFFRSVLFHLFDARKITGMPGCLHGIVQRSDGQHVTSPQVPQLLDEEKRLGLLTIKTLNTFAAAAEDKKFSVRRAVESAKEKGLVVAGYGANSSAVTMIHEFGWTAENITCVVDDGTHSAGAIIPGTQIPVISWSEAAGRKIGALVVFGNQFLGGINMDRVATFQSTGGTVITMK